MVLSSVSEVIVIVVVKVIVIMIVIVIVKVIVIVLTPQHAISLTGWSVPAR